MWSKFGGATKKTLMHAYEHLNRDLCMGLRLLGSARAAVIECLAPMSCCLLDVGQVLAPAHRGNCATCN